MGAVATTPPRGRWLFGPLPDLMLGCGLAYLIIFVVLSVAGGEMRALVPAGALALGALVTGMPHYGATLMRVYDQREDRRTYAVFSLWATLVIAAAFVVGTHSAAVASALFTIYVTWNAWHYTGQNYGISLMCLGRNGVAVAPTEKRLVYATFVLSYLLILVSIHGGGGAGYAPQAQEGWVVRFVSLGIPNTLVNGALTILATAYVAALVGAVVLLRRRAASWRDLGPAALLVVTQAAWFVLPTLARASGTFQGIEPLSQQYADYAFYWVAYAHSVQYLWISTYYARARDPQLGRISYFWKALLAGTALWGIPALLFAPQALGALPYGGGLVLLVAAVVNLHHFVLDGAIWKLRDGRIARILLRNDGVKAPVAAPAPIRPTFGFARPLIWVAGAACAAIFVLDTWERRVGYGEALAREDSDRMATAMQRLAWVGRDEADLHYSLAVVLAKQQRIGDAIDHLERSIEREPSAAAWTGLAEMHELRREWRDAAAAYDQALALAPDHVPALQRSGALLLQLGQPAPARARLEKALSLDPTNAYTAQVLRTAGG
jgi:tetratricopeptide (TPR) repeat protein